MHTSTQTEPSCRSKKFESSIQSQRSSNSTQATGQLEILSPDLRSLKCVMGSLGSYPDLPKRYSTPGPDPGKGTGRLPPENTSMGPQTGTLGSREFQPQTQSPTPNPISGRVPNSVPCMCREAHSGTAHVWAHFWDNFEKSNIPKSEMRKIFIPSGGLHLNL